MKKIFMFFLLGIYGFCDAQVGNALSVPSSVSVLGEQYSATFTEQAVILGQIEKKLADRKTQFPTMNALVAFSCTEWGRLSGTPCSVDENTLSSYLGSIGQGGENYETCISGLGVSEELKRIFLDINTAIRHFETETDLNTLLHSYSSNLPAYNLSEGDKERLKMYIVSLNFGYHVLMHSTPVRERMSLYPNIPITDRNIWGWIRGAIRCGLGTIGGAVLGGLAGAGIGTVTLPVLGTVSATAAGLWGGALAGASQSCF